MTRSVRSAPRSLLLLASLTGAMACRRSPPPSPDPAPSASPAVGAAASVSAAQNSPAASASAPLAPPPTVNAELFAPDGSHPQAVFALENATVFLDHGRVARLHDGALEWLPSRVPSHPDVGEMNIDGGVVRWLGGRWPDRVDAMRDSPSGRAPMSTYLPVSGPGTSYKPADNAVNSVNVVSVGERTIFVAQTLAEGFVFTTVRGPRATYKFQKPAQFKCMKDWETQIVGMGSFQHNYPALIPFVATSTRGGTLVHVGRLCDGRPMAEVWDQGDTSRLVELGEGVKVGDAARWRVGESTVRGAGEELWFSMDEGTSLLHYQGGAFSVSAPAPVKVSQLFASRDGTPHVSDGTSVYRLRDARWEPVARLNWPLPVLTMAIEDDTLWITAGSIGFASDDAPLVRDTAVYRLRPAPPVEYADSCTTPFVFLYSVSPKNDRKFTFPGTRKALASFPDAAQLGLVEFREGSYQLGLTVPSRAVADAVIAHLATAMPDEHPKLICYTPQNPRQVPLKK